MLRTCWCNASGNTKVSDVGPGWYFLHTIPSTMSSCDQSWAYLFDGGFSNRCVEGVAQNGVHCTAAGSFCPASSASGMILCSSMSIGRECPSESAGVVELQCQQTC